MTLQFGNDQNPYLNPVEVKENSNGTADRRTSTSLGRGGSGALDVAYHATICGVALSGHNGSRRAGDGDEPRSPVLARVRLRAPISVHRDESRLKAPRPVNSENWARRLRELNLRSKLVKTKA